MDKKDLEFKDITVEEAMKKILSEKNKIIEAFAKAYLAESGLLPSQVELVCKQVTENNIIENVYYFRKKE